jgi:hypothetical protein
VHPRRQRQRWRRHHRLLHRHRPQTIRPATNLPAVEGTTTIDGRTQPGWAGAPLIQIDGPSDIAARDSVGLNLRGDRSQVLDLSVTGFATGLYMFGNEQGLAGCYIGLDPSGAARANGTGIDLSASHCTIGSTPDVSDGNVISGNDQYGGAFVWDGAGIWIHGHLNTLTGNRIGTNPAGTAKCRTSGASGSGATPTTSAPPKRPRGGSGT